MRTLVSIELSDFGRFAHKKIDLSGRLIGIVGPNGAGKSTILKAIKFAYTGEVPKVGRRGPVRIGRTGTDQPYVKLDFISSSGEPTTIIRWVPDGKRDGRRRLVCGEESLSTSDEVNDWISRDAGVPVNIASDILFVAQGRLNDVITDPPAKRAEVIHRLFGLEAAEAARKAAISHLESLPSPPGPESLDLARARHSEISSALDASNRELMSLPPPNPNREKADSLISRAVRAEALLPVRDRLLGQINTFKSRLQMPDVIGPTKEELDKAAAADRKVSNFLAATKRNARVRFEHEQALSELNRLKAKPKLDPGPHPTPPEELFRLQGSKSLYEAISSCRIGDNCPVCGSAVESARSESSVQEANDKLNRLVKLESEFNTSVSDWSKLFDEFVEWQEEVSLAEQRIKSSSYISNDPDHHDIPPTPEESNLASIYSKLSNDYEKSKTDAKERDEAVARLAQLMKEVQVIDDELIGFHPDEVSAARDLIEKDNEIEDRRRSLHARLDVLTESHRKSASDLARIESVYEAATRTGSWRSVVSEAAAAVHRDAAPAVAASELLRDLAEDVNDRLVELATGFSVEIDSEGSVIAVPHGRRSEAVPVEMASGGEQTGLALAWRMATVDLVAPSANILCLDEPTYGLDDHRIEALRSALSAWRPTDERQIIVVTHDRRLAGVFDTLIEL